MRRILSALLLFSFVIGVPSISHARTGPVFSVPFTWSEKGHIMVDAVINDSWRLPMIVDTGAQFALLPRAAIEKLDIKKAEISVQHAMTASDTRQLEVITIDKITVGGHSVANLNGLLLDLHDLPGHGQAPGVLPMSFLNGFTVQFDLANQRLAFYDKQLPVKAFLDLDKY
ncbi:MAG: retroviral-like aspartic protease family protein, partial [Gammaproteobacteria bacterium]|nr:retroviral-like aspartic protease family protein [Gammaproteobacteria bacterium]